MNKLVFSEGGQPVYLEDLKLLQDNMMELILSLFSLTHGSTDPTSDDADYPDSVGLGVYATARHQNGSADANYEWWQAHKLITPNGIYDVPETHWSEQDEYEASQSGGPYYLLSESVVESREFEDGQTRPVVKRCTAQIVAQRPASGTYYRMADVPSFDGQLERLLNIRRRVLRSYYAVELEH